VITVSGVEEKARVKKSIKVEYEVWKALQRMKIEGGFRDLNDVIEYLLEKCGESQSKVE
jgi:Organiser of macrodomain of Terminus of chromosome.